MIHETTFVGIDVCKTRFDVCIQPGDKNFSCGTSAEEIGRLIEHLAMPGPVVVGLEASGGYESRLADKLAMAGLVVHILAPARVRGFARAIGQQANTDAIDAAVIARYLAVTHHRLTPYVPDPERQKLSLLTAHRRRLIEEKAALSVSSTRSTSRLCAP